MENYLNEKFSCIYDVSSLHEERQMIEKDIDQYIPAQGDTGMILAKDAEEKV